MATFAGCVTTPNSGGEARRDACPPGRTLICTQRLGREDKCSCEREEEFKEILEPMKR
jgi:hypothetical protein